MAKTKRNTATKNRTEELLEDLLILLLGKEGVTQHEIRKIVGVDINKVSRIVKNLGRKQHDVR